VGNNIPDHCWYPPCAVKGSTTELVRSIDLKGQCPTSEQICSNVVQFINQSGASYNQEQIAQIEQLTNCSFTPPAPAPAPTPNPTVQSWSCATGGCTGVNDTTGQFSSLSACLNTCSNPTPTPGPNPGPNPTPGPTPTPSGTPWYKSWWAILIYIVLGILLVVLIIWAIVSASKKNKGNQK